MLTESLKLLNPPKPKPKPKKKTQQQIFMMQSPKNNKGRY
jgi:hypothetical protein